MVEDKLRKGSKNARDENGTKSHDDERDKTEGQKSGGKPGKNGES